MCNIYRGWTVRNQIKPASLGSDTKGVRVVLKRQYSNWLWHKVKCCVSSTMTDWLTDLTALACGHLQANCQPDTWRWSYDRTFTMELSMVLGFKQSQPLQHMKLPISNFNINGLLDERKHNLHSFFIQIKQFINWQCVPHTWPAPRIPHQHVSIQSYPSSHNTHNLTTTREWFALSSRQGSYH